MFRFKMFVKCKDITNYLEILCLLHIIAVSSYKLFVFLHKKLKTIVPDNLVSVIKDYLPLWQIDRLCFIEPASHSKPQRYVQYILNIREKSCTVL